MIWDKVSWIGGSCCGLKASGSEKNLLVCCNGGCLTVKENWKDDAGFGKVVVKVIWTESDDDQLRANEIIVEIDLAVGGAMMSVNCCCYCSWLFGHSYRCCYCCEMVMMSVFANCCLNCGHWRKDDARGFFHGHGSFVDGSVVRSELCLLE